jgi:DNA-binding IclR family transcriptional regulator
VLTFWCIPRIRKVREIGLNATLQDEQVTRRGWQVLNALQQGAGTAADVDEQVRPFLSDVDPTATPILQQLRERGWVSLDGERYHLTSHVAAGFDRLRDKVSADRRTVTNGIDVDEYRTTLAVLERMARNLGWD